MFKTPADVEDGALVTVVDSNAKSLILHVQGASGYDDK